MGENKMKLEKLLERMDYKVLAGSTDIEISTLVYDSRKVEKASVFVCISGAVSDAHDFIPDVVKKGAAAVVVEKDVTPIEGVTYIKVDNTRLALACMSAAYFDYPAEKIKTIGITGTKGKTTTTYMVRSILESAGIKTGLIGTIESICGDKRIPSANTTPESYRVQELFKEMVDEGLDAVVMEVSSQALMLHRVSGFTFDIGVFTNLEPDHIGEHEHKDFADYMHCKSLLFRQCRLGIFNGDDEHLEGIMKGHTCQVETYGYKSTNNLVAENVELKKEHGALGVKYHVSGLLDFDVEVNVPGKFSVYNSLTAIAICHHFNVDKKAIGEALHHVSVKGRIEIVPITKRYTLMIDYAHNATLGDRFGLDDRQTRPQVVTLYAQALERAFPEIYTHVTPLVSRREAKMAREVIAQQKAARGAKKGEPESEKSGRSEGKQTARRRGKSEQE